MTNNSILGGIGSPDGYTGVRAPQPPNIVSFNRAPVSGTFSKDIKNFTIGDIWIDESQSPPVPYMLVNKSQGKPTWVAFASSGGGAINFITDSGTATEVGGNLNDLGGDLINTVGSGSTVKTALNRGTNGQIIVAKTGGASAYAHLTSSGGTITVTEGANTLNIDTSGSVVIQINDDDGGMATPAAGIITFHDGNNIEVVASGSGVTTNVAGTTTHAVQIGNASGSLTSLAVGSNGQVLIGSTGADPAFSTLTSSGGTITFTTGAHTLNLEAAGSVAIQFNGDSGTSTPSAGIEKIIGAVSGNITTAASSNQVTIAVSGTTNHAIQLGNSTGSLSSLTVGTTGQMLTGNSAANPSWITAGNNGQVIIGSTGGLPAFATLTSTGGTITYTTGANSLNLEAAASPASTCAFLAKLTVQQANVTGQNETVTVNYTTVTFDVGSNYDGTNTFTAPATGKYFLSYIVPYANVSINVGGGSIGFNSDLVTTNQTYDYVSDFATKGQASLGFALLTNMTAGDTAHITGRCNGQGATTVSFGAFIGQFSGYRVL